MKSSWLGSFMAMAHAVVFVGCSSNGGPPAMHHSKASIEDVSTKAESVGDWACYPDLGNYIVHYTLKADEPAACPELKDQPAQIIQWKGRLPTYPDCKVTVDEASCTLKTICEYQDSKVTTNTIYAKGERPPVSGTRVIVTKPVTQATADPPPATTSDGTVIDLTPAPPPATPPKSVECHYDFTYAKK